MDIIDFSRLFQRHGGYAMPVLVELKHPEKPSWHFTNNRQDVEWGGNLYIAVPMGYKPPSSRDGVPTGGSLEISVDEQAGSGDELLRWFDEADGREELEAVAIISEQGTITAVGQLLHRHGTVSWDGEKITWNLGEDDRFQMQINPWSFDADALIG